MKAGRPPKDRELISDNVTNLSDDRGNSESYTLREACEGMHSMQTLPPRVCHGGRTAVGWGGESIQKADTNAERT